MSDVSGDLCIEAPIERRPRLKSATYIGGTISSRRQGEKTNLVVTRLNKKVYHGGRIRNHPPQKQELDPFCILMSVKVSFQNELPCFASYLKSCIHELLHGSKELKVHSMHPDPA